MIQPYHHPLADETAQWFAAAFGAETPHIVMEVQKVIGNTEFMRALEAYCFVHETTADDQPHIMMQREGMRRVVLMLHAARAINIDKLKEAPDV